MEFCGGILVHTGVDKVQVLELTASALKRPVAGGDVVIPAVETERDR